MSSSFLQSSTADLVERYDVALLDLDGVVYVGPKAVPHAPESLRSARDRGMRLAFVTNNAARPPQVVAQHLTDLGIDATPDEVITSSQAAAHYLSDRLPPGSPVLIVGTTGLIEAVRERGLTPVFSADDGPVAVVQGYSPDLDWKQLAEGAVAINAGALWVATNADPTVPSPRGPLPGNGSLVAALRHATKVEPVVTGKPDPTMHRETVLRSAARHPLVVGDRLDTDIEGANAAECDSLLVLTGVTTPADLLTAPASLRPTYLGRDLRAVLLAHPAVERSADAAVCGAWRARATGLASVELASGQADAGAHDAAGADGALDALRALCVAAWARADAGSATDEGAVEARPSAVAVAAADDAADSVVRAWGL